MFKSAVNQQYALWVTNNSGTIIRVLILLLVLITAVISPEVVLADAVMGGSVG